MSLAGGGSHSVWLLLVGVVLLSLHVFVGLVGADVDQRGDVPDVGVLRCLAAGVQCGDRELDAAAADLGHERLLVEVAEVLLAHFVERDQDVAEDAVKQFDGG